MDGDILNDTLASVRRPDGVTQVRHAGDIASFAGCAHARPIDVGTSPQKAFHDLVSMG